MKHTVITIARGFGSGGKTLGHLLAKELGINCYDRDLIRLASESSGINEALFGEIDEKVKISSLFRNFMKKPSDKVLPPESDGFTSNDNLFNIQAEIIKKLASQESCVIIGRCADYILRDYENVIRLYLYAPKEECIKRVRKTNSGSDQEIMKKIQNTDKYRSDYYHYYTGKEWNDARNYDFCLNTSSMSYEKLIEIVKSYIKTYMEE